MINKEVEKIIIVIPSLNPDDKLISYINELVSVGFNRIVVVNDGSNREYDNIFNAIKNIKEVSYLVHEVNRGKGAALKTAFKYIKDNKEDAIGILTVDADGQHLAKDCVKIAKEMFKREKGLYLGCRDFNESIVPFKSRFGNKLTSFLFKCLYKRSLNDTQTGLRGFFVEDIDLMLNIEGDRYEYEMEMLIMASLNGLDFICIPIETVYIDDNASSHFRPLKDGLKIYKILFRKHSK